MTQPDSELEHRKLEFGRELIVHWVALLRAVPLYAAGNVTIASQCELIRNTARKFVDMDGELEIAVRYDSIFVNGLRIRETVIGSTSYQRFIDLLRAVGVGVLSMDGEATVSEIELCARLLWESVQGSRGASELTRELAVKGVSHVQIEAATQSDELPEEITADRIARQVYLHSISVVKGIFQELRSVDRISARRVKRVVQQMIDSLERNPDSLMNLTSLKNYDEYTFNHSVNVGVLGIALGRQVGLTSQQLYAIGQAGMLHDLGKLYIPRELLNKAGRLTPQERKLMEAHSVEGFISIAQKLGASADTLEVALTAFEHHLNADGTGYPQVGGARPKGLLSRIISIVDRYDAMTTDRVYRKAMSPQKALAIMFNTGSSHFDPVLLKHFLNLMGHYPLGTTVRLSDGSIAVVVGGTSRPQLRHCPVVKLILDSEGRAADGSTCDLSTSAADLGALRVEATVDPQQYGIEVMDYILG